MYSNHTDGQKPLIVGMKFFNRNSDLVERRLLSSEDSIIISKSGIEHGMTRVNPFTGKFIISFTPLTYTCIHLNCNSFIIHIKIGILYFVGRRKFSWKPMNPPSHKKDITYDPHQKLAAGVTCPVCKK